MKLDARILKNPLNGFDFKLAEKFIGKSGYFGDRVEDFFRLDELKHDLLLRIDEYNGCFYYGDNIISDFSAYFLPDEYVNQVEPIKECITLAKLLSKLEVNQNNRVIIYDDFEVMIFDSDDLDSYNYYEYWKWLEEKVCRYSDTTRNGKRSVYIFMS